MAVRQDLSVCDWSRYAISNNVRYDMPIHECAKIGVDVFRKGLLGFCSTPIGQLHRYSRIHAGRVQLAPGTLRPASDFGAMNNSVSLYSEP